MSHTADFVTISVLLGKKNTQKKPKKNQLHPDIHMEVSLMFSTHLIATSHIVTVLPYSSGLPQQDNSGPCKNGLGRAQRKWQRDRGGNPAFKLPRYQNDEIWWHLWEASLFHNEHTPQSTGPKGSVANVLILDTLGQTQICFVHTLTTQGCFGDVRQLVLMVWLTYVYSYVFGCIQNK